MEVFILMRRFLTGAAGAALILLFSLIKAPCGAEAAANVVSGSGITIASGSAITYVRVNYSTEDVRINASKQIYYAPLKKASDITAKATDLVAAAVDPNSPGAYLIDISTLSASKANYLGIAETNVSTDGKTVPVTCIPINATQKKITFNIAWGQEGAVAEGYRILDSVAITEFSGVNVVYDRNTSVETEGHKRLNAANLDIEWRKGSNCAWESLSDLTSVRWASMVNSGAIIYMRVAARDDQTNIPGHRYSKEVKIKLTITKPTTLKLDTSKLTVNLKNGSQFRLAGSTNVNDWRTVLPYNANGTSKKALRPASSAAVLFDPYKESTSEKRTYVSVDEIRSLIGGTATDKTKPVTIETRIAATTTKPAARPALIVIPAQAGAPSASLSKVADGYLVSTITKASGDDDTPGYEYFICLLSDYNSGYIDMATVKWFAVRSGSELKRSLKCSYTTSTGQRREVYMNSVGAVLLIRRKGVAASSKVAGVLASEPARITIP